MPHSVKLRTTLNGGRVIGWSDARIGSHFIYKLLKNEAYNCIAMDIATQWYVNEIAGYSEI